MKTEDHIAMVVLLFAASMRRNAQRVSRRELAASDVIAGSPQDRSANPQDQIYSSRTDGTGNTKLIVANIGLHHL